MIYLVVDVMEVGVALKLEGTDRSIVKRAIKALEEAVFKFQQHGFDLDDDWLEELKLAAVDLEDLLE